MSPAVRSTRCFTRRRDEIDATRMSNIADRPPSVENKRACLKRLLFHRGKLSRRDALRKITLVVKRQKPMTEMKKDVA